MGGISSFFSSKPPRSKAQVFQDTLGAEADARAIKAEKDKKKRAALKLAQLATGAGGLFSDAPTGKRKLFGN